MWDLRIRNRGIFVLISVLSGCAVLYNAWGPILALTLSIILVIYVCYSLLTNDTILTPQTFVFIKYLKESGQELTVYLNTASFYLSSTIRKLYIILNNNYRTYVANKMNRFRQNTYQLSNDNRDTSRNSSRFDLTTNQLSPISRNEYQENISYENRVRNEHYSGTKLTSTPLVPLRKDTNLLSNGAIGLFTPARPLRQETQLNYSPNHPSRHTNETVFSPEGSPWGTSISPKIRPRAAGIKTVQTIAGPLLASTRYNIDPKVYSDVTSPGLSTRLAKYATEANNKLTHQSQYATGQFPKVNLSTSPLPLISVKNSKTRTPVTVRIAPPEASRYSPPERQRLISDVCRAENRAASSVVQVLREISLKRHASKEDVSTDLAKKQRTEGIYDDCFDNSEDLTHKRTREDSPNDEEGILANNNQLRPVKKTKPPSCFDVLNSLSSSSQYSSGVKRKASTLDLSRSSTPDVEKHFKASDAVGATPKISVNVAESQTEVGKPQKHDLNEKSSPSMEIEVAKKLQEQAMVRVKGILKGQPSKDAVVDQQQNQSIEKHVKLDDEKETQATKNSSPVTNKPINYTDKLFMKAEPQTNERLRMLIQEQGNIRAKFTTDDVDEIKKEDIVNMRQTSMKARLQSMFDAISGKPAKKINPDIIIHAEGSSEPTTPATPASLVTLSSTTLTTNINTSPITTSAVAPNGAPKLGGTTTTKHVTFNLPSSQSSTSQSSPSTNTSTLTGFKTNTTETGNLICEAPKLSFGTVVLTTTTPSLITSSPVTISSSNTQNTNANSVVALSLVNSSIAPSSFVAATPSIQNSIPSLESPSVNVTSTTNNGLNLAKVTTIVPKVSSPSSSTAFNSSSYSIVPQNSNVMAFPKTPTTLVTGIIPTSTPSAGNFTSQSNKMIENVNTKTPTSVPMPDFSFGAPKMSSAVSVFNGNNQVALATTQNQITTTKTNVTPATTASFILSSVTQAQQSAFNITSTTGSTMVPPSTGATTPSLFPFVGNIAAQQTTNTGSFAFTTVTNTGKSQIPTFGSAVSTQQSTPVFGGAAAQNPPSFGNAINFQNVQSPGNVSTTTSQNAQTFSSHLTSNQNPPAFGSAVTTTQNVSTFGTVASSAPPPSFGNMSTSSSFAFGNTTAQTSAISGFGTNSNSTAQSTIMSSTNPTFSFGSSATPNPKSGFAFDAIAAPTKASSGGIGITSTSNQITTFEAAAGGNTAPAFGKPSTTAPPAFGAPSTTAPPVFGGPSTTVTPVFGAASTTATPVFGAATTTATPVFGGISTTSTPAFGVTSSSTATPLFGSSAVTTTSTMFEGTVNQSFGGVSSAGAPNSFGTPKTTAPPAFGSQTNESGFSYGAVNMGQNVFAGTSLTTTSNTTAQPTAVPAFGANAGSKNVFGQTKSPPSFVASTAVTFGNSGTPSFGNQSATFGAASNSIPAGNNSAFGNQNSTTPAFGTQNPVAKQTVQSPPPVFGSSNSAFGVTTSAPPAFGANTVTSSGFGSSATTFGTQNSALPPSFGASTANTSNAFGVSVSAPFGGQNQSSTPAFGAQNPTAPSFGTTNNNTNASFGFGGNQTQTQQNSGYAFTGTAGNTNNTTTPAPFQFGGTSAKTEGFNFNASTTTPNMNFGTTASASFGTPTQGTNMFGTTSPAVPAGGMFSIGAGSTAPRTRSTRTRRQR